jgi:hypothetical protein
MRGALVRRLVRCAVVAFLVLAGTWGTANAQSSRSTPKELWSEYPLNPVEAETNPAIGASETTRSGRLTTREGAGEPAGRPAGGDSDESPGTDVAGAVALSIALLVILVIAAGAFPRTAIRRLSSARADDDQKAPRTAPAGEFTRPGAWFAAWATDLVSWAHSHATTSSPVPRADPDPPDTTAKSEAPVDAPLGKAQSPPKEDIPVPMARPADKEVRISAARPVQKRPQPARDRPVDHGSQERSGTEPA